MRPPIPSITLSRRTKIALWVVGVLVVAIIVFVQLTGVYINWLWFDSVGDSQVYATMFWTRLVLFFVFGGLMALIIGGNLLIAYLLRPPFRPMSTEQQNIERYRVMLEPRRVLILALVSVIAFLAAGISAQGDWAAWQLWLHGTSFGARDPLFHLDISFYAWDYPVYRLLLGFGFAALIVAIILSAIVHYISGAIRLQTPGPKITLAARRHLTVLVFVFIVLKAIAYWLDRYGLVFSDRSKFTGASYTDVHAVLPARTILFWIALILAAGVLASLWLRSTLFPGIAFVSMLVLSILISGIYPAVLQHFSVSPNASVKEAPYIKRNITATREAYGIQTGTDVDYTPYKPTTKPNLRAPTQQSDPTIANIRILDPNIISPTFQKFQQGGSNVYGFQSKLDVDRYTVNGKERDYIVGVRELDAANLRGDQTNWINEHTNYTHGYGFVAAQADKDITDGKTPFAAGGIPPSGEIRAKQPEVYYGELLPDYSIVGASGSDQEFNANGGQKVSYSGGGGVSLGSWFTRLAFAVDYKQTNFLLNDAASAKGAKIIFNRDPRSMVQKVAPFLKIDSDPYPIVDTSTGNPTSGHIVWMVDGYTTMDNYPYSERRSLSGLTNDSLAATNKTAKQPNDQVNYIRNSVKATVDAYTGKVTLYDWNEQDPVLRSWMRIFPNLIQPRSTMPQSILEHVRYPQDLFKVQRSLLGTYHVSNPVTFYNTSNRWTVPKDPTDSSLGNQPAYYVLAANPTAPNGAAEFQLTSPMNVNSNTYLAAYLSVNSDPLSRSYGKITALQLPRGSTVVQAPEQVYSRFTSNNIIRKDSLYATGNGSANVLHGNLLTLPLDNSFLYVEPLYTLSSTNTGGAYPILSRVIVGYGDSDRLGYGSSLKKALSDFEPGRTTGQTLGLSSGATSVGPTSTPRPPTNPTPPPPPQSGSSGPTSSPPSSSTTSTAPGAVTLQQVENAHQKAQQAINSGDYAAASKYLEEEHRLFGEYLKEHPGAIPPAPAGSGTPAPSTSG